MHRDNLTSYLKIYNYKPLPPYELHNWHTGPSNLTLYVYVRCGKEHLRDLLTPLSRVLLEKLTGFAASQKFPKFMEPESSLP
jgi:hypothetical protein